MVWTTAFNNSIFKFNSIYSPASGKIIFDSILMGLTKLFTLFAKPCLTAFLLPSAASISLVLKIIDVSESSVRNLAGMQKHFHNLTVLIANFKWSTCFCSVNRTHRGVGDLGAARLLCEQQTTFSVCENVESSDSSMEKIVCTN